MPQVVAVMIAGAGIYAGLRWLSRTLEHHVREAQLHAEELSRRATDATRVTKDLGTLEYDPATRVYKPRGSGPHRG